MAADNSSTLHPWFQHNDQWLSEVFATENQSLVKSMQFSASDSNSSAVPSPETLSTPTSSISSHFTVSQCSPVSNPNRKKNLLPSGKISKRRTRATTRCPTTYITADPANFREMVQRVTGMQFGGGVGVVEPRMEQVCLPTIDTSVFVGRESVLGFKEVEQFVSSFPVVESWGVG